MKFKTIALLAYAAYAYDKKQREAGKKSPFSSVSEFFSKTMADRNAPIGATPATRPM